MMLNMDRLLTITVIFLVISAVICEEEKNDDDDTSKVGKPKCQVCKGIVKKFIEVRKIINVFLIVLG